MWTGWEQTLPPVFLCPGKALIGAANRRLESSTNHGDMRKMPLFSGCIP
jgi:hypothetical protein